MCRNDDGALPPHSCLQLRTLTGSVDSTADAHSPKLSSLLPAGAAGLAAPRRRRLSGPAAGVLCAPRPPSYTPLLSLHAPLPT